MFHFKKKNNLILSKENLYIHFYAAQGYFEFSEDSLF